MSYAHRSATSRICLGCERMRIHHRSGRFRYTGVAGPLLSADPPLNMPKLFQIPKVAGVTKATAKQQMLKQLNCTDAPEQALRYHGYSVIAGVDEVGRGALFGPVVAAAVVLPSRSGVLVRMGLKDSKQLTREDRERLDRKIRKLALGIGVAEIDAETIDRINIYHATRLAMLRAVEGLDLAPDHVILDAMLIDHPCPQTKLFYGDALCLSIAAASVIAKVHRDALMRKLDRLHPEYGLAQHKGYATPEHRKALLEHGPTPLHRRTFNAVALSDRDALLDEVVGEGEPFDREELDTEANGLTVCEVERPLCLHRSSDGSEATANPQQVPVTHNGDAA